MTILLPIHIPHIFLLFFCLLFSFLLISSIFFPGLILYTRAEK